MASIDGVRLAALDLVRIDTNKSGGSEAYRNGLARLQTAVMALADNERVLCQQLIQVMSQHFVAKTPGSWRPFIIAIVRAAGAAEADVSAACAYARIKEQDVQHVEALSPSPGDGMTVCVSRKRRSEPNKENTSGNAKRKPTQQPSRSTVSTEASNEKAEGKAKRKPTQLSLQSNEPPAPLRIAESTAVNADKSEVPAPNSGQRAGGLQRWLRPVTSRTTEIPDGPQDAASDDTPAGRKSTGSTPSAAGSTGSTCSSKAAQAAPSACSTTADDPLCYYARLGVHFSAGFAEIKRAYYRKALDCHPDKGGSSETFQMLVESFEVLSDPDKRAMYGSQGPYIAGQRAGSRSTGQSTCTCETAAARTLLATMLLMQPDSWDQLLMGADVQILQRASKLGSAYNRATAQRNKPRLDFQALAASAEQAAPRGYRTGFKRLKNGYLWLQVGWRSFKVKPATPLPPEQFDQAVRLHIALQEVRVSARRRHQRLTQMLGHKSSVQASAAGGQRDHLDECPVLTHAELLHLLQEEPLVPLVFATDLSGPPRIQAPWTPNLDSANHFLVLMRRALANKFPMDEVKQLMRQQVTHDLGDRASLRHDALLRVREELVRRGAKNPADNDEQVPQQPAPPPPLAIAEKAHAEIEDLKIALLEAKKAQADAEDRLDQEAQRVGDVEREKEVLKRARDEALRAAVASTRRLRQHPFGGRGLRSSEEHESDMQRHGLRAAARQLNARGTAAARAWEAAGVTCEVYPSRRGM